MPQSNEFISNSLAWLHDRTISRIEKFTSGRNWLLKIFLLCVFFSIFFSGGVDLGLPGRGYPESYFQKIEHPLLDVAKIYGLNSHEANVNFRLTVPVIFHVLGIHARWSLPLLTIAAISLILIVSALIAHQITGDRVCACLIGLNVASTYVGSYGFIAYYDAIALCQLALAALPRMPWWGRGLLVFSASFTDERAFVASGLLLAGQLFFAGQNQTWLSRLLNRKVLVIVAAQLSYCIARLALMKFAGLSSPTGGNGPGMLVNENFKFLHPAIWFSLEGGWLFFALAVFALWTRRDFGAGTVLMLASLCFLGFGLMIGDVMRSTIYIFPLLFICLDVVKRNESLSMLRNYCLAAFLISALGGNYNVYLGKITWFQPLLIHWLQILAQSFYDCIYSLLPHTMPRATPLN
jgi:hypothetical protein